MKIINQKKEKPTHRFVEVRYGDVFRTKANNEDPDFIFMKISPIQTTHSVANAVRLLDGAWTNMPSGEEVYIVDAELIIKG